VNAVPLRRNRDFVLLQTGQLLSNLGSRMTSIAYPLLVLAMTGSPAKAGFVAFARILPVALFTLPAGVAADRWNRRRMMIAADGVRVVAVSVLVATIWLDSTLFWPVAVIAFVEGVGAAFFTAAYPGAMRSVVSVEQLPDAVAAQTGRMAVVQLAGSPLGGALYTVGRSVPFVVDVVSYVFSAVSLIAMRSPFQLEREHDPSPLRSRLVEGLRFVWSRRVIMGIFLVDSNAMIFGMPSALFPALAAHRFHAGAGTVGLLYAAPYAGALAASIFSGWIGRISRQALAVAVFAGAWGLALIGFGFAEALWLALVFLALAGAADFVSAALRTTIVLQATPDPMRGRVSGIELAQVAAAPTLGNVEAGLVAALTSLRFSIVSGGFLCVAGTAVLVAAIPDIVRYRARAAT